MVPRGETWRELKLLCLAGAVGALLQEDRQCICSALRYYCNHVCAERFLILRNRDEQICPRFINGSRVPIETGGRGGWVRSCSQPGWAPYTLPGCWCYQGSFGGRRTTPKCCLRGAGFHQEGRKIEGGSRMLRQLHGWE